MRIELLNNIQLDEFIASQSHAQFLQSWDWGEFQRAVGHGVWRLGVFNRTEIGHDQLLASAQIIQHKLPLKKSYLYCARGPVFDEKLTDKQKQEALELILSKARDIIIATSQTEEIFFRFEPTIAIHDTRYMLHDTRPIQPANTLILDLTQSIEQLLANMHPKTRYNIKVAEKHSITIQEEIDFDQVWPLFLQTSKRDKFGIHSKNYYQKMLADIPWIKLWTAIYQNQIVAAAIIGSFGDTATYIHGASDYNFRQLMAPYLLHWTVIQTAKKQNFKCYDFYGIAPATNLQPQTSNRKHPWSGITRFKLGFGGQIKNYPGAFDFIYEAGWYKMYKTLRIINLFLRKKGY